ncbi:MAG: uridine kinase [Leptolyngbyaceae cyanobacterium]
MISLETAVELVTQQQVLLPQSRSLLVAISGIDGAGKGYITRQMVELLARPDRKIATINIDGWLNLPGKRFSPNNPAGQFYHHAIRFDELFTQLVFPLRDRRSLILEANHTEETAQTYRKHTYQFENIDIILLEGIYLLKQSFQANYDLSFWVECSFATALDRAIARSQEGLSPAETVNAYQTIYFPAQQIHFERDRPQTAATAIIDNDD